MGFVTERQLQREFQLPKALAGEIEVEQTQRVLRSRWQPWAWLLCWLLPAAACWFGWLPGYPGLHAHLAANALLLIACAGWIGIARWLAAPAMLVAASTKARRLGLVSKGQAGA